MKTYFLERLYTDDKVTLGRFWFEGKTVYMLELPYKDNQKNISCIPDGVYDVTWTFSPAFGRHLWLVQNVPNRSGIRIHPANMVSELRGCLAPGMDKKDINKDGIIDVVNSRKAFGLMRSLMPDDFKLEIIWNILPDFWES